MAGQRVRFTRRDLEQLPEDWRAELVCGDLLMLPAPDPSRQVLVAGLLVALRNHLGNDGQHRVVMAPTDIVIDDESVLQPDLVVLPQSAGGRARQLAHPFDECGSSAAVT